MESHPPVSDEIKGQCLIAGFKLTEKLFEEEVKEALMDRLHREALPEQFESQ